MIFFKENNVYIEKDETFSVAKTFDCGQCFRFEKTDDGFSGVAFGKYIRVTEENGFVVLHGVGKDEYIEIWGRFFDIDRDYNAINEKLACDSVVKKAIEKSKGIRILRQDKWETLCSFIISQNNNIPRIKKIVSSLCENFGDKIGEGLYAFPSAEKVLSVGVDGLAVIRSGFRAKYIIDAAQKVVSGDVDLDAIDSMSYGEAKEYLMKIKGVGSKVADCVLLFAYSFFDAFPKDVWIKRVIEKYYGENFDESVFAPYGGIAQQYLFYYERYENE